MVAAAEARGEEARRAALHSHLAVDPARCALAAAHFPEWRRLLGDAGPGGAGAGAPPALPHAPAAHDPAFLLPFCVAALRRGLLGPRAFAHLGLASVCLRATAAEDAALCGMAFEALALFDAQLAPPAHGRRDAGAGAGEGAAAAARDFKERPQLR